MSEAPEWSAWRRSRIDEDGQLVEESIDPGPEVASTFPFGAKCVPFGSGPDPIFSVVGLECREVEPGRWLMRGWAYPNKDMVFDITEAEVNPAGWIVKRGDVEYSLIPLSERDGVALEAAIDEVW